MKQYNINVCQAYSTNNTTFVSVPGRILKEHELLPIKFFIHRRVNGINPTVYSPNTWVISEYETGFQMVHGNTQKETIANLSMLIERKALTVSKLQELITTNVNKYGKANE